MDRTEAGARLCAYASVVVTALSLVSAPSSIASAPPTSLPKPPQLALERRLAGCGDLPGQLAFNIKANIACRKARSVVKNWDGKLHGSSGSFDCDFKATGYEEGRVRCTSRGREVRWITAS